MRLSTYALVALAAFGGIVPSNSAVGQNLQSSVALDALGTARQLASEGRLHDALRIAYLVQRLPDLTENESESCRKLLDQCQSLAISLYIEQNTPEVRPVVEAYDTLEQSRHDGVGESRDEDPAREFGQDPAGTASENALLFSALHGRDETFSREGDFVSRVPRLLDEHSSEPLSFDAVPNEAHRTTGGLTANLQPAPPLFSMELRSDVFPRATWGHIAGISILVLLGLFAGSVGHGLLRVGRLVVKVGYRCFHRPALSVWSYGSTNPLQSSTETKSDGGFSDICARIADDNRRLR